MIKIKGNVTVGPMRGKALIEKFFFRLAGIVGYEPFKGTLDVRLETPVDVQLYATKKVEEVLMDGTHKVDIYLAPIVLSAKGHDIECWAIKQPGSAYKDDLVEIMTNKNLKERLTLQNGDEVEVTFFDPQTKKKNVPGLGIMKKLYGVENKLNA